MDAPHTCEGHPDGTGPFAGIRSSSHMMDGAVHGQCQTNAPTMQRTDPIHTLMIPIHGSIMHGAVNAWMGQAPINTTGGGPSVHGCTTTASMTVAINGMTNALPPLLLQMQRHTNSR